jgi:uncharacterized protein
MQTVIDQVPFYPGRAPIDAYGNGGFRFAGMSHRGSIICLPSGISAWDPVRLEDLSLQAFAQVLLERSEIAVLLLGTGLELRHPGVEVRSGLAEAGIGVEPMDTGAACRTYNVLLAEGRPIAAALLAVD